MTCRRECAFEYSCCSSNQWLLRVRVHCRATGGSGILTDFRRHPQAAELFISCSRETRCAIEEIRGRVHKITTVLSPISVRSEPHCHRSQFRFLLGSEPHRLLMVTCPLLARDWLVLWFMHLCPCSVGQSSALSLADEMAARFSGCGQ